MRERFHRMSYCDRLYIKVAVLGNLIFIAVLALTEKGL